MSKINKFEMQISEVYDLYEVALHNADRVADGKETFKFFLEAQKKLAEFKNSITPPPFHASLLEGNHVSSQDLLNTMSQIGKNLIKISL